jgi:flagellar protein FliS
LSTYASPQAYREAAVLTASPVQLVVMLYDGVERFLRQAEVVMEEGGVAQAHDRMQRGEAIIDELLRTLDKSAGEVAERLEAIYVFCKRLMMEARLEKDPSKLAKVRSLMAELRESWAELAESGAAA